MDSNGKPVVVFLSLADFAASAYNACCAVNHVGKIEAHHIVLSHPPYDFPAEIICPIAFQDKIDPETAPNFNQVQELLEKADLIHCWNNEREGFPKFANLAIPFNKVKSYTFTGTSYRLYHKEVNANIRKLPGARVIVQDPLFLRFFDEFPVEFIPHAVNTDLLKLSRCKRANTIGIYNKNDHEYANYIYLLRQLLRKTCPQWQLIPGTTTCWRPRLLEISKCMFFFQNLSQQLGNPGRSTYEALAMGIPVFTYISPEVFALTSRLDGCPVIITSVQTLERIVPKTLERKDYEQLSKQSRLWVENTLSYDRVGIEYTKLFEDLLF